jgi:hypothetical protein
MDVVHGPLTHQHLLALGRRLSTPLTRHRDFTLGNLNAPCRDVGAVNPNDTIMDSA